MNLPSSHPNTLPALLAQAATRRGNATFLLFGDERVSYSELHLASQRVAQGLAGLGVGRGDRVGLLALNRPEWLVLFFACARLGAVTVGMSPRYRSSELTHILRDSSVKAVATISEHEGCDFPALFSQLSADLPSLEHLILLSDGSPPVDSGRLRCIPYPQLNDTGCAANLPALEETVESDDLAMVIYTSGTTGRPKGACLTHRSMIASASAQSSHMRITEKDLLPLPSPLNHVAGITCGVLAVLVGGGRIDLLPEFKTSQMLDRIRLHRPTMLAGVPTMLTLILMHAQEKNIDFSSLRLVFMGGSNIDPTLLTALQTRMPGAKLMNLYGLSECSGAIVITPWEASDDDLMQTIGMPIGDAQVRVVTPGGFDDVPPGEVGELCFRGCGVVRGYMSTTGSSDAFMAGGWLRTGDLGQIDSRGVIALLGRAKDMYIQGGFNVYPVEVEAHIALHPDVLMVAGVGAPDPVLGEIGYYFVVRKPGSLLTADALLAWCADSLADYKVPRRIAFREMLPLTPAGKIHKAALREEVREKPPRS